MYKRILEEVQKVTTATMYSPVTRQAIQAMVVIAGWSTDGGWLSLGHAIRMAMEIGMHKAWPNLFKRIKSGKMSDDEDERMLVISTRTWFCLYVFEQQCVIFSSCLAWIIYLLSQDVTRYRAACDFARK